ncbi:cysteine dioxygenase family protein [Streptomyces pactum]|uniref:Cysteine dioxygenase n=1 Tax=Streptomyces pactum TaxID=68249 RepID=A0A1S6J5M4_9ACTN|nr:cysteine dioxygenase family protein [Streptomyces pactum]AQS67068.1 hypothetical protein B1H29_09170 [Streptomyces pactum]
MMPAPSSRGSRLDVLVREIRQGLRVPVGRCEQAGRRVADIVAAHLRHDDLLTEEQLTPDPAAYKQHVLHIEPDGTFSVVALVWLPGQHTPIHDHVCWCVIGVHRGAEEEIRYRLVDEDGSPHLVPVDVTVNHTGTVAHLSPPGDIHEVRSATDGLTVSLHVYGADVGRLGTSVRRRYDLPVRLPHAALGAAQRPVRP